MSPALLTVWRIDRAGSPAEELPEAEIVRDVERFCWSIIARMAAARELTATDKDELFSALLEKVVILTRSYDPHRRGIRFDLWLHNELGRDAIDFLRQWRGRNGEKGVYDERFVTGGREPDEGGSARSDHGGAALDQPGDAAETDGDPARGARALPDAWTDLRRDRARARPLGGLGLLEGQDAA